MINDQSDSDLGFSMCDKKLDQGDLSTEKSGFLNFSV